MRPPVFRSALRPALALLLAAGLLWPSATVAQYQPEAGNRYPDPDKCLVVVEAMSKIGFRIADAQALAERTTTAFRRRLGRDAVIYEGLLKQAKEMKRRLAGTETSIQDEQIAYYRAASKAAPWRVKVTFGKKRGKHWVKATCHAAKGGKKVKKPVESKTWRNKSFDKLKTLYGEEIKAFCTRMDPPKAAPAATAVPKPKKKKAWSLPPMRR